MFLPSPSSPRNSFFSRSCCWQAVRRRRRKRRRRGAYCFPPLYCPLARRRSFTAARLFLRGRGGGDQNGTKKGEGKHPSLVPQPPPASFSPPRPTSSCANWPLPAAAAAAAGPCSTAAGGPISFVSQPLRIHHASVKVDTGGGGGRGRRPAKKEGNPSSDCRSSSV